MRQSSGFLKIQLTHYWGDGVEAFLGEGRGGGGVGDIFKALLTCASGCLNTCLRHYWGEGRGEGYVDRPPQTSHTSTQQPSPVLVLGSDPGNTITASCDGFLEAF